MNNKELPKDEDYPPYKDLKDIDWNEINRLSLKMYKEFSKTQGYCDEESPLEGYYSNNYFNMKIKKIMLGPVNYKSLIYFWDILDDFTELHKCFIHMQRLYHFTDGAYPDNNKDIYQVLYYKLYESTLKGENELIFKGKIYKMELDSYKDDTHEFIKLSSLGDVEYHNSRSALPIYYKVDKDKVRDFFIILKSVFGKRFINNFSENKYAWRIKLTNGDGRVYEYKSVDPLYCSLDSVTDLLKKTLNNNELIGFDGFVCDKLNEITLNMIINNKKERVVFDINNREVKYNNKTIHLSGMNFEDLMFIDYNRVLWDKDYFIDNNYKRFLLTFDFENSGKLSFSEINLSKKYVYELSSTMRLNIVLFDLHPMIYGLDKLLKELNIPTNLFGDYLLLKEKEPVIMQHYEEESQRERK